MLDIPEDFLRVPVPATERQNYQIGQEEYVDSESTSGMRQENLAVRPSGFSPSTTPHGSNIQGKLSVTIAQVRQKYFFFALYPFRVTSLSCLYYVGQAGKELWSYQNGSIRS
jgi:hypothetical protein